MTIEKVAIITGASKGLGQALALGMLGPSVLVVAVARHSSLELEEQAKQTGSPLRQISADLSDVATLPATANRVFSDLPDTANRYVLINNAGTVDPVRAAARLDDAAAITAAFTLNVTSPMVLGAEFLRRTQPLKVDRRILNISSGAGRRPMPGWGVYCATKAALDMYSQVVQAEEDEARIASIAPGVIDTGMQSHIRQSDPRDFPGLASFMSLHDQGQLTPPHVVAAKLIRYIDRDDFGATVLDDIRNYD